MSDDTKRTPPAPEEDEDETGEALGFEVDPEETGLVVDQTPAQLLKDAYMTNMHKRPSSALQRDLQAERANEGPAALPPSVSVSAAKVVEEWFTGFPRLGGAMQGLMETLRAALQAEQAEPADVVDGTHSMPSYAMVLLQRVHAFWAGGIDDPKLAEEIATLLHGAPQGPHLSESVTRIPSPDERMDARDWLRCNDPDLHEYVYRGHSASGTHQLARHFEEQWVYARRRAAGDVDVPNEPRRSVIERVRDAVTDVRSDVASQLHALADKLLRKRRYVDCVKCRRDEHREGATYCGGCGERLPDCPEPAPADLDSTTTMVDAPVDHSLDGLDDLPF